MKILHTADWQIGMKAAHLKGAGSRVREERLRSARRVIKLANENRVDLVILAGDTFEDHSVSPFTVREVIAILETSDAPVFVLPGNHDYLCSGSVWHYSDWEKSDKITILKNFQPIVVEGATLFPCPSTERKSALNPMAWIPLEKSSGFRIAIAHGSVEGIEMENPDSPIPRDITAQKDLDYVALGHWHSFAKIDTSTGCRMAYSGTHEQTRFGERDSGNCCLVTLKSKNDLPEIVQVKTGGLSWESSIITITAAGELQKSAEFLFETAYPESTLLRIEFQGVYPMEEIDILGRLKALEESGKFLFCEIRTERLHVLQTDLSWIEQISEPFLKMTAERIARGENGIAEQVRERALLELYTIFKGSLR